MIINKKTPTPKLTKSLFINSIISSAIIGTPPRCISPVSVNSLITSLIAAIFWWLIFFRFPFLLSYSTSIFLSSFSSSIFNFSLARKSFLFLSNSTNCSSLLRLTIKEVNWPSSLIIRFLNIGLSNISFFARLISISGSIIVFILSALSLFSGTLATFSKGRSINVITSWTFSKFSSLLFKLLIFSNEFRENKFSFGL